MRSMSAAKHVAALVVLCFQFVIRYEERRNRDNSDNLVITSLIQATISRTMVRELFRDKTMSRKLFSWTRRSKSDCHGPSRRLRSTD
jgi:hypothetical protein